MNTMFPCDFSCSDQIFTFLDLKSLLTFGSSSRWALRAILPTIARRRKRMKRLYAYYRHWEHTKNECKKPVRPWDHVQANTGWVIIPTVQERVNQLQKHIPASHPLSFAVEELAENILVEFDEDKFLTIDLASFHDLLSELRKVLYAHKLHAGILAWAMESDPVVCDNMAHTDPNGCERSTTLDRYIGDVLCVAYLINGSNLSIVEGGPTYTTFVRDIRHQPAGSSCYRSWVYLHSSILQLKSFTDDERDRLGIPEFCGVSAMIPHDCYINEFFMSSEMTLVFNEFGPLGATFRQRDIVRLRDIAARRLFAFFITNDNHIRGETTRSALEWLCLVHEEARKARPMSVRAPVMRLYSQLSTV